LFNKKLISEQEYNAGQAAFDVAKNTHESSLHEIERAEASSSQARDQLSKTTIYSPLDGTITILNSKLGERLVATGQFAGTEVMRVADLTHMQAIVDVNENDVVNVKLGDKASVKIDAYGDRKFKGVVQQIANTGKTTGSGTQEEVTNFEVKIRIDDHDVALRPALSLYRGHPNQRGERCRGRADAGRDHSHGRNQFESRRNRKEKAEGRAAGQRRQ